MKTDLTLQKLYGNHEKFEDELDKYKHKTFLTPEEQIRIKELKMQKLKGVEKMLNMADAA